jgi:hypothetical protein
MDVLLAPVYESFLHERDACLKHGGFVVGPIGAATATDLFEECVARGTRDPASRARFVFAPMLPGIIYESHVAGGAGGYRFVGLIDEIEINDSNARYRDERMKPGRGESGEKADAERMPAYVRFKTVWPIVEVVPGLRELRPAECGQSEAVLRRFKFGELRRTDLREAIDRLIRAHGAAER